jgi:hypothetical protein
MNLPSSVNVNVPIFGAFSFGINPAACDLNHGPLFYKKASNSVCELEIFKICLWKAYVCSVYCITAVSLSYAEFFGQDGVFNNQSRYGSKNT